MNVSDQNQICRFGSLDFGACVMLSAFGATHFALKLQISEARPYPAAMLFNHPQVNNAPGVLMVGSDSFVLNVADASIELASEPKHISFTRDDEIPGTLLKSSDSLFLVAYLAPGQLIYVDMRKGETQHYPERDYVAVKKWRIFRPADPNQTTLTSFELKESP